MELYEAIFKRRDIRQFRPDPMPEETYARILKAAHHAGSVGFKEKPLPEEAGWENLTALEDLVYSNR